jgi:uncharacterized membrane protein YvlD (DUF360 family)
MPQMNSSTEQLGWKPQRPRLRVVRLVTTWMVSAVALLLAADVLAGVTIEGVWGAVAVAATISVLNTFVPPLIAAARLPATLITGFVVLIVLNALMIEWASSITEHAITVSGFGAALMTALVTAAFSIGLASILGIDDDDEYTFHIVRRIARRHRAAERADTPGLIFLEIDGLALPILRRAMQDGNAPTLAGWLGSGSHALFEWETDLSSQTGVSQAGILLGSNSDIPAFRWVEKERGANVTCSSPRDCTEIERRHLDGGGLLRGGGASRGNLLPVTPTPRSSPSVDSPPRSVPTRAIGPFSQTPTTSRAASCCSSGRSGWSCSPPRCNAAATSGPGGTAADAIRSSGPRCACSSATSSSNP